MSGSSSHTTGSSTRLAAVAVQVDATCRITGWDADAERFFACPADQALGQSIGLFLSGVEPLLRDALAAPSDGVPFAVDTTARLPHASDIPATVVVCTRTGTPARLGLLVLPRPLDPAAIEASRRLAAIVESSDDAIVSKDLNGIVRTWNRGAERTFGYTADEMIGTSIRRIIPDDRQAEEDMTLATICRGDKVHHFETLRQSKSGELIPISLTVSPIRNERGDIVGASKIARDTSSIKAAERERVRLLEESVAITETLSQVGAAVASDLDRASMVQAVTAAAAGLTTATFGAFFYDVFNDAGDSHLLYAVTGIPHEAVSSFPVPQSAQVFDRLFRRQPVFRSGDITQDDRIDDGAMPDHLLLDHLAVRSCLAVPVKARNGRVLGALFLGHPGIDRFTPQHERLVTGIASWASVALENARLYERAQEASRLKDDFLASLSHELRTPLNAILGYARLVSAGIIGPEQLQKAIETIERNAEALAHMVEDVLDVSRIIAGKLRLNVQRIEFADVIRAAVDAVVPAADAKGVRLETVLDQQALISGDPDRLQQVLWNLLSNAVKFTSRDGSVQVRLQRVDAHFEVTVSDTGAGIPHDVLPHVFERFRQGETGTTRGRGGLGLGLAIARQLVEMHGGTIAAESAGPGAGATFRVRVPVMIGQHRQATHPNVYAPIRYGGPDSERSDLSGLHVLAVDDETDALSLLADVLQAAGARVTTARSVAEALNAIAAAVPDVVIADIGMPGQDGFALIEGIRRHPNPRVQALPTAALTAYARSDDRMKALRAGFHIHLAKPIEPAELTTTVASLARRFGGAGDTPAS